MSEPSNARPGAATPPEDGSDALPSGTRLAEFEIRQVLGAGGFGIVYRAWDEALERDVALKEYMPVSLAGRGNGGGVTLRSRTHAETFALGKQSFVNEARLLARFDHPALVKVFRFWEGNGTAYMAMPLYKGRTLRQLRKTAAPGTFDEAWVRALVEPLLGALEVMHAAEVFHRDIAPDNILWCDDNRPVLLDFGAARLALGDRTQNLTAILKPQFAPIEQYAETQAMRQGPWTDLYALAGTVYFMLTGRAPLPATARVVADELEPLVQAAPPGCSPRLLQILDWAMAVRPQDRPQSVAQMREALAGRIPVPAQPGAFAPTVAHTAPEAGYEKTIQVKPQTPPARRAAAPAPAASRASTFGPASRSRGEHFGDTPDRSVMLPPKSQSPLKAVLLLVVLIGIGAGAWTTRQQWMPAVGLQDYLPAVAQAASAPDAAASAPVAAAEPASAPASEPVPLAVAAPASAAASETVVASDTPASAAPAVEAPDSAPAPVATAAKTRATRAKATADAHSKALAARIAAIPLPPPTLPPANEAQVVSQSKPLVAPDPAEPAPTTSHGLGPREACAGLAPVKMAACVKQLCDNEPRYQAYPVCQRVHRQEEKQQSGAAE